MKPPKGGRPAALQIEVMIASARWRRRPKTAGLIRTAIRTAARSMAKSGSTPRAELAIVLTDDSAIRALNHHWRKLDAPTNVLSFPASPARGGKIPRHLGDIVIAYESVAREAAAEEKTFDHHLVHLAVHGYLHLLGYDHASNHDAKNMERLEVGILARLGVPDPYLARRRAM